MTWGQFGIELAALLAVAALVTLVSLSFVYPQLGLPPSGPVPQRTVLLVLVITAFLRRGSERWSDFGLRWRARAWKLSHSCSFSS